MAGQGERGTEMARCEHGGDTLSFQEKFGAPPIDFSANINPLGMSPRTLSAARDALARADRYPDPACRRLRAALAARSGIDAAHIRCGNGAADLIYRLCLAERPNRVLVCTPTFSEYEHAARAAGAEIVRYELPESRGFAADQGLIDAIEPGIDMVFICEPNNPTGLLSETSVLRGLRLRCRELGVRLVVDECFAGFARGSVTDPVPSMEPFVEKMPGLVVLSAFTKLYGMAGLRLGYLMCSDEELLARLDAVGQPWSVSSIAEEAGIAALGDDSYVGRALDLVGKERPRLSAALASFGCEVWPSGANYLLLFCPIPGMCDRLAELGVMVRDCSNYPGLREGYLRVAVRTPQENDCLIVAMSSAVASAREEGLELLPAPELPDWWSGVRSWGSWRAVDESGYGAGMR